MTIDEAIVMYERLTKEKENEAEWFADIDSSAEFEFYEESKRYRQLAEWLKELRAYREATEETFRLTQAGECGRGIRLCMDVYSEHLKQKGEQND